MAVKVVVSSGNSLARLALENIKLVNYEDREIVTVVLPCIFEYKSSFFAGKQSIFRHIDLYSSHS